MIRGVVPPVDRDGCSYRRRSGLVTRVARVTAEIEIAVAKRAICRFNYVSYRFNVQGDDIMNGR